jgi:hypothetical protein
VSETTARNRIDYRHPRNALATVDSGVALKPRERVAGDFYVEPRWAVDALLDVEPFVGRSWDPACGIGTIPDAMNARQMACWGSDIVDRGWVDFLRCFEQHDFPGNGVAVGIPAPDNIVCNPPYNLAEAFIRHALAMATNKVAMLLRLSFLEGRKRGEMFRSTPLARVWVFSRRVSMPPGGMDIPAKGGAVAFAWYVWQHGWRGPPHLGWLP